MSFVQEILDYYSFYKTLHNFFKSHKLNSALLHHSSRIYIHWETVIITAVGTHIYHCTLNSQHLKVSNTLSLLSSNAIFSLFLHKNWPSRNRTGISHRYSSLKQTFSGASISTCLSFSLCMKGASSIFTVSHKGQGSFVKRTSSGRSRPPTCLDGGDGDGYSDKTRKDVLQHRCHCTFSSCGKCTKTDGGY